MHEHQEAVIIESFERVNEHIRINWSPLILDLDLDVPDGFKVIVIEAVVEWNISSFILQVLKLIIKASLYNFLRLVILT